MKNTLKKIAACVVAVTSLAVGVGSLNVNALSNRYSTISPYKSGSNVYFGVTVTNKTNSSSDFTYWGNLKNNVTGAMIPSAVSDLEYDLGENVTTTLRGSFAYADLPDQTLCVNYVNAYYSYSSAASQYYYEQYANNTYYNK